MFAAKQQTSLMKKLAKIPRNSKEVDLELHYAMTDVMAKLLKTVAHSANARAALIQRAKDCIANTVNKADFICNLNSTKESLEEHNVDPVKSIAIIETLVATLAATTNENINQTIKTISCHRFSVSTYLYIAEAIRLVELLTSKEIKALVKQYLAKRDALCLPHMRLVHKIAQSFITKPSSHDLEDLTTTGWEGLVIAADRFDPSIWQHFGTYASSWIKQVLQRHTINCGTTIRIPVHLSENISEIRRKSAEMEALNGAKPTTQELSEATNLSVERINRAQGAMYQTISLDSSIEGSGMSNASFAISDIIADENAVSPDQDTFDGELRELVSSILKDTLDARSVMVLSLRYGLASGEETPMTEVATAFNISRERVRQLNDVSFELIRARTKTKVLKDFLT